MPKITWLGDVDDPHPDRDGYGDSHCTWGDYTFVRGVPVEVTDPHIIKKARTNRFFRLDEDTPETPPAPAPAAAANNPAPVKRSHKKKVVP